MQPVELFVRCLAERHDGVWQAFCLDFDLAVQGDSLKDVKQKLHAQIAEYVYDALAGEDQRYARHLLRRTAPWHMYLKWHFYHMLGKLRLAKRRFTTFDEISPLRPICPNAA